VAMTPRARGAPSHCPRSVASTELAWAVVPAVALALVLAATWRALHPAPASTRAPLPAERLTAREGTQAPRGGAPA
jgi:hypothetical protein